jgi:hypothetical protein
MADLAQAWGDRPRPSPLTDLLEAGARGPGILAEKLWEYWTVAIEPHWSRICAVLEADVAFRMGALAERGLFALLDDLHCEAAVQGHDLLVNKPHHADATYRATQLILTPSVFGYPASLSRTASQGSSTSPIPRTAWGGCGKAWNRPAMSRTTSSPPCWAGPGRRSWNVPPSRSAPRRWRASSARALERSASTSRC